MQQFFIRPRIISGVDSLNYLNKTKAKKAFIVTDAFLVSSHLVDKVVGALPKEADHYIYSDVKPDPSQELIDAGTEKILAEKPDLVIAFGGGSAIDACKTIVFQASRSMPRPLFVVIPTTAGTGSEVTNFAIVTRGTKKDVLVDDSLLPDLALLDSTFTKSVPANITADTGLDVFTHAVEAYLSTNSSPFTDVFALKAMKDVLAHLPKVFEDGYKMSSRQKMIEASTMAGIAFTNAGLGIIHSLAHIIGGKFHISHGRLNAIILPYVLDFYIKRSEDVRKRINDLELELGIDKGSFICCYKALQKTLKIEGSLAGLNKIFSVDYNNMIEEMAEIALNDRCTPTSPVYVTKQDLVNILRDLY